MFRVGASRHRARRPPAFIATGATYLFAPERHSVSLICPMTPYSNDPAYSDSNRRLFQLNRARPFIGIHHYEWLEDVKNQ